MSPATTPRELAQVMSIFEIDEALHCLIQSMEEEAEANNGAVSEQLKDAVVRYFDAHLHKVDRIAAYVKAQEAEAWVAGREAERLAARQKAARNRAERTKAMLVYFMNARGVRQLRGSLNTIGLQGNSNASLIVNEAARVPDEYFNAKLEIPLPQWRELLDLASDLTVNRATPFAARVEVELDRARLRAALENGAVIHGASLVKGQHARIR
jgi:hypothetical protein